MKRKCKNENICKRRKIFLTTVVMISVAALTGCGGKGYFTQRYPGDFDSVRLEDSSETEIVFSQPEPLEPEASAEPEQVITPRLPSTGRTLSDFVLDEWRILDSVKLDFNEDGLFDYVAVLQVEWVEGRETWRFPRILFAVASDGKGQYRLDFQDVNLIRTSEEGGVYGDPYLPLTAEGTSFTTHSYGGSGWRWSEDYTYEYIDGTWYLTLAEEIFGYGEYITEYSRNDWKTGVGIRKERNASFSDMEEHWEEEGEPEYDLVYEMTLDEMPTLYQAGMRRWSATDRVTDWEVKEIAFAEDVEPSEDLVRYPGAGISFGYCDENCALYISRQEESEKAYLVMYCWQDRKLTILKETDADTFSLSLYKDYIYYVSDIVETIKYRTMVDGKECIEEREDTVGLRFNRINVDGTGQMTIWEYRYPGTEQEILDGWPPYLSLNYEISGDEIVAELWGDVPHPYYRMNLDGTGRQIIGYVSK